MAAAFPIDSLTVELLERLRPDLVAQIRAAAPAPATTARQVDLLGTPAPAEVERHGVAATVLALLNRVAGRSFRPTEATLRPIAARLADGYRLDDCERVIRDRHLRWGTDPKMREYLRPETLFRAGKFEGYLQAALEAEAQPARGVPLSPLDERNVEAGLAWLNRHQRQPQRQGVIR